MLHIMCTHVRKFVCACFNSQMCIFLSIFNKLCFNRDIAIRLMVHVRDMKVMLSGGLSCPASDYITFIS